MHLTVIMPVYNERHLVSTSIERVLSVQHPRISKLDLVIVDDASNDGTSEVLDGIAAAHPDRVKLLRHEENAGKGAAIQTAIGAAEGELVLFQDADLEYDVADYPKLVEPFFTDTADVVYGSRFLAGERRRVLYFWHTLGNRFLTFLSNATTDLNLTDVETCYKVFRRDLIQSIPLRSSRFGIEPEITAKIAKRRARIFEVPISYSGRTYQEGKKISWKDGVSAIYTILRFWLVDDIYKKDQYGSHILQSLDKARRFNRWMADQLTPWAGDRILEIGAGIGNITAFLTPRDRYIVSDINPHYLRYLHNLALGRPYMEVAKIDLQEEEDFHPYAGQMDTVVCLNVLEHVPDPDLALRNLFATLAPGGRLLLYVPAIPALYSTLDEVLEHRCRYTKASLAAEAERAGFEVEKMWQFNRSAVPGWILNGKILRRRSFGRLQLKIYDTLTPLIRRIDRLMPWPGLGLMMVARRP